MEEIERCQIGFKHSFKRILYKKGGKEERERERERDVGMKREIKV